MNPILRIALPSQIRKRSGQMIWLGLWSLAGVLGTQAPALAQVDPNQEIVWIDNYQKGLEESQALRKPQLILVTSNDCVWCQKLLKETLVEPNIKAKLKTQWICTRIDASTNRAMAETLKVRNLPTIILANPKGKVIANLEGFQNPQVLATQLDRTRFLWEAESEMLTSLFREAVSKIRQRDLAGAGELLAKVVENPSDTQMRQEATYLLDLVKRGDPDSLMQIPDQPFQDILAKYGIQTSNTNEAPGALASRSTEKNPPPLALGSSNDLLQAAKDDLVKKQIAAALEKLDWVVQQRPESPEGIQARKIMKDLQQNTESLRTAVDQMQEKLTQALLHLAETNLASGDPQQAISCLEQVLRISPASRNAEIAQTRLAQLQGQPGRVK